MAKNLQVKLTFLADTNAARTSLQQLQQTLSNVAAQPMQSQGINTMRTQIAEAQAKAAELKVALQNATNVNTGKLNFNKFSQQLKQNKTSLEQYAAALQRLGPQGTQAFSQLATAIRQSEMPIVALKGKVAALGQTLANTARWQLSSMMIQGFMSSIRNTINYAKDLNESLNNIRIVTGKSVEEMSRFAKYANEMAKALSASTTEYTKASLIYYQQGLSDSEVKERTDTTLKLAKVVSEEASTVSEWMTAIWNNFDDGSRALERYADVVAALGAATASSADEIAGGLEKFAAVADTVGLSYEYAASALATITAETRQSEDVVGTALKTIFARIEGLNLGETLDDGTTLNKYSEALYKVGVNIKDQNGNLKNMDDILDAIGNKWNYLNKDQQVALAQSVAGIRQYNQFIALMSNWDVMQDNLDIARNSTGELERQHEIFEEGIEGSAKRVQARLEGIKNAILNENDLIPILEIADNFLEIIESLVKSLGGLPGILLVITSLLTKAFGASMAKGLEAMVSGITTLKGVMSGTAQTDRSNMITKTTKMAANMAISDTNIGSKEGAAISNSLKDQERMTKSEEENVNRLNAQYKETLNILRQIVEEKHRIAQESGREADLAATQGMRAETALKTAGLTNQETDQIRRAGMYQDRVDTFENTNYRSGKASLEAAGQIKNTVAETFGADSQQAQALEKAYNKLSKAENNYTQLQQKAMEKKKNNIALTKEEKAELNRANKARQTERKNYADVAKSVDVAGKTKRNYSQVNKETGGAVDNLIAAEEKGAEASKRGTAAIRDKDAALKQYNKTLAEGTAVGQHWTTGFIKGVGTMASTAAGIMMISNSISSISQAASEGKLSFNAFLGAATSLLFGLSMMAPIIQSVTAAMQAQGLVGIKGLGILTAEWLMTKLTTKAKREKIREIQKEEAADAKANLKKIANIFFNIGEQASKGPKGWITAAISAALVAALIGVAIAVNASNKAQNDEEEKEAQATAKYAKTVSEAYDKVRESYEDLKKSLEDYKGAQEAIGKLQKGTLEWKQAIQEANQQVVELIDKYPELAQYVTNQEGRLIISDEGQQAILQQQGQEVAAMANIKANANLKADQARYAADKKAALTTTFDTYDVGDFFANIGKQAAQMASLGFASGAATGSAAGGVGAVPGAVVGASIGATIGPIAGLVQSIVENNQAYDNSENAINAISEAYLKQGEAIFVNLDKTFEELNITDQELIDSLKENKDSLEELTRTNAQLIEQEKLVQQQKVDNLLYSQEHFITENYGEGVQQGAVKQYEKLRKDALSQYEGKWHTTAFFGNQRGTKKGEEAFAEYARIMGYEDADATDFQGKKVVFKYKEGDEVKKDMEVTYEDIEQAIAEYGAALQAGELANAVNQMTSQVRILQNSSNSVEQAVGSFLENGDLSYLDPKVYEEIKNANVNISEEQATLFGYDSVAQAEEAFATALNNYDAAIAKTNILAREQQNINTILADGAAELEQSETALRAYAESLANSSQYLNENKEAAAKMAVQHYRTAIGISELKKALNDNLKALEDNTAGSLDYYEALGAVKEGLEKAFGVKVSAKFVEDNLPKIKEMANGSVEALQELRKELVKDFIVNLNIDDSYKTALENEILRLSEIAENSPIGMELELNNSKAIEGINQALEAGAMTVEEVEALFANANLAMPQYNVAKVPHTTTSNSHTVSTIDQWWGKQTVTSDSTTTNTTWSEIPYFGDNPPIYDLNATTGEYEKRAGTGVESSMKVTTMANQNADSQILDYGGKGSSTGETSTEKNKRFKDLDKEIERYHELDQAIAKLEKDIASLNRAKKQAFGQNYLKYLEDEINKQKQLLSLQVDRQTAVKNNYINIDRQTLLNTYEVKLDTNGYISNYNELIQEQINKLKAIPDANSQNYKDQKAYLDQMKQDFEDYEKSLQEMYDAQEAIEEQQLLLQELALEKITVEVEIKVEIAEDDKAYIDFLLQETEDDVFAVAENINLQTQSGEAIMSQIAATKDGIEKTKTALQNGEITPAQAAEQLRQYRNDLISYNADLLEIRNTVEESLVNAYEAWNEELDTNASKIEHLTSITESLKNIVDIVGKDTLGLSDAAMKKFSDTSVEVANNALEASKSKLDANQAYLDEVKQKYAEAEATYGKESHEAKYWADIVKGAEEQVMSAREDFMSSWETALTAAADAFSASVDQITENFSESMGGMYKNLDELQEAFDKQKEINDRYLENYEKTYEISKLNRSIQDSINKTSSVASQKELRGLQQELLAMQEDGVNVSERDIQFMQKKYDLMVAEQALRDAQNAKSVVRLRRDSEGNFGYTYTADQSTVDKAQQNYEDKLYDMQKFGDESLEEIQQQILETNQEFKQALEDIANDETLSLDEKKEKAAQVTKFYQDKLKYLTDEANKFMQRGQEINVKYNTDMASSFNDTLLGKMYPDLTSFEGYYEQGMSNMNTAGSDFTIALEGYQSRIDTAFDLAGQDVETFANDVAGDNGYLDQVQEAGDDTAENAEDLASRMKEALITDEDSAIKSVTSFQEDFGQRMKTVRDETQETILKIKDLINELNLLNNTTTTTVDYSVFEHSTTPPPVVNSDSDLTIDDETTDGDNSPTTGGFVQGQTLMIGGATFVYTNTGQLIPMSDIIKDWGPVKANDPNGDHHYEITSTARSFDGAEAFLYGLDNGVGYNIPTDVLVGQTETYGSGDSPGSAGYNIYWNNNSGEAITVMALSGDYVKIKRTDGAIFQGKDWWTTNWAGSREVWVKKSTLANCYSIDAETFDTGGYTGDWGPEGRLAMLHQKEIVLNAHDTENFLAAIGIVRDISDQIERNAMVMQYQNAMANNKFALGNVGETLEQNVHITAEFPNATNHSEIEEAFRNLTNLASQYANRKRV